jgi:glutamate dehydrogenase (NAD(P)+)
MPGVKIHKLTSADAFIVFDLDDAPAVGATRSAPKILVDGATLLARTLTYRFASFERRLGGASSGINAAPEALAAAIAAYVAEVGPMFTAGRVLLEPAKGLSAEDFAPLRAVDPRPEAYWDLEDELAGLGAAVAAEAAGGLAGRTVAIEGFDATGPALARAVAERGGRVVAVATAAGTARSAEGFGPEALAAGWAEHGAGLVTAEVIGVAASEPAAPGAVFGVEADVLVAGSKPGVIDHEVAAGVVARVVVPGGPVPVTAKGLAVLRRAGVLVLPDFVTTAGPLFAWPDGDGTVTDPRRPEEARAAVTDGIAGVLAEVLGNEDGPLLAACYRAESFLRGWREQLPFGRPLA